MSANTPAFRRRSWWTLAVGLIVSAVFVTLAFRDIAFDALIHEIAQVNVGLLALAVVVQFTSFLLITLRSRVLLNPLHRYGFGALLRSVFVAYIGNNILPARIGELMRVHFLARLANQPHSSCLAVLLLERLFDVFYLVLIFFCVIPLVATDMSDYAALAVLGVALTAIIGGFVLVSNRLEAFVAFWRRVSSPLGATASGFITDKAERFAEGLTALRSPSALVWVGLLSLAYWLAGALAIQVCFWAFGLELPWYASLVALVFVSLGTALPSAPGYVGTYHYFMLIALQLFAVGSATAASVALVVHAVASVPLTVLGAPFVLSDIVAMSTDRDDGLDEEAV